MTSSSSRRGANPGLTVPSSTSFSSVQSCLTLWPHGLQHARPPCPSPTPRVHSNSCPLSWWCHPTISSSVFPFSFCLQSFPASGSFQMSQFFPSGGQSIGVSASASVLPMNIEEWFPQFTSLRYINPTRVFGSATSPGPAPSQSNRPILLLSSCYLEQWRPLSLKMREETVCDCSTATAIE